MSELVMSFRGNLASVFLLIGLLGLGADGASAADWPQITLVTQSYDGTQPGNSQWNNSIGDERFTADGRYLFFASQASNLTPAGYQVMVIYKKDLQTGSIEAVNLGPSGGIIPSFFPSVTDDGRYAVFGDVWLRDTVLGKTSQITGRWACCPQISGDGRYVAFVSRENLVDLNHSPAAGLNVYVWSRLENQIRVVSVRHDGQAYANVSSSSPVEGGAESPLISHDGRFIVFYSKSTDIVDTPSETGCDIYVRDTVAGTTRRLNQKYDNTGGSWAPVGLYTIRFLPDGRRLSFWSYGDDLLPPNERPAHPTGLYFYDCVDGTIETLNLDDLAPIQYSDWITASTNNRYVAFQGRDSSDYYRLGIYLLDTVGRHLTLIDGNRDGVSGLSQVYPKFITNDGRFVVFSSPSTNLTTECIGARGWYTERLFVHDVKEGVTSLVGKTFRGDMPPEEVRFPLLSPDDRFLVFTSAADDIVPFDHNGYNDLFLYRLDPNPKRPLFFPRLPVPSPSEMTGFGWTNAGSSPATLALKAYDENGALISGASIENPKTIALAPGQQMARMEAELFGPGVGAQGRLSWVEGETDSSKVSGFYLGLNGAFTELDGANAAQRTHGSLLFPEIDPSSTITLTIVNTGTALASVTIRLMDGSTGQVKVALDPIAVKAKGFLSRTLPQLFPGQTLDADDYVVAEGDGPLIGSERIRDAEGSTSVLAALDPRTGNGSLAAAQFVAGSGFYRSKMTIVNPSEQAITVHMALLADDGSGIAGSGDMAIPAKGKLLVDGADFFGDFPDMVSGWLSVWASTPVVGSVSFADSAGKRLRTSLALLDRRPRVSLFSHVASTETYFTGLAIVNTDYLQAEVTIQVCDKDGKVIATREETLAPGQRISQLLTEYFPQLQGQMIGSGYIRLECPTGISAFALFGTWDLTAISAIPSQVVPFQ